MQDELDPTQPDLGAEPGMDAPTDMGATAELGAAPAGAGAPTPDGGHDREGAMAKADLYKLASYSHKLFKQIDDNDQLEAWVQAKITKAADYIASVYHYLEYEMKFSEYGKALDNSDVLSEGQKRVLKSRLLEAKAKVKELKVAQAEKVAESFPTVAGAKADAEKSKGTGKFDKKEIKPGVTQYTRKSSTFTDGGDDTDTKKAKKKAKEVAEGFPTVADAKKEAEKSKGTGKFDVKKTSTGTQYTRKSSTFTDGGDDTDTKKAKKKAKDMAEGKVQDHHEDLVHAAAIVAGLKRRKDMPKTPKAPKASQSPVVPFDDGMDIEDECSGMESPLSAAPRQVHPKVKAKLERYGKETEAMAAAVRRIADKDYDGDGKIETEKAEVIGSRRKAAGLDEGKPSAGLSKAEKSATVKKAKAGGDIGKPGKNFDKVAKAAGGGKKGEKIAAAAMWKNIKEAVKAKKVEEETASANTVTDPKEREALMKSSDPQAYNKLKGIKPAGKPTVAVSDPEGVKETVNESADMLRMREQLGRLNRAETHQLVEATEADKLRALTQRLNG